MTSLRDISNLERPKSSIVVHCIITAGMGTGANYKKEHERRRFSFIPSKWFVLYGMKFFPSIFLPISMVLFFMLFSCENGSCGQQRQQENGAGSFLRSLLPSTSSPSCLVSFGRYHGLEYTTPQGGNGGGGRTVGKPKCLVESKFMKLQQHRVQQPGSSSVIEDWMWIDYHDRINVLVQAPNSLDHFLVFEQTKYALEGRTSLAVVGGMIEPGEEPEQAARREVAEEMKQSCLNFHFLGRYRTDVNRGYGSTRIQHTCTAIRSHNLSLSLFDRSGWTNTFLATNCHKLTETEQTRMDIDNSAAVGTKEEEVGAADTERQDLRTLSLQELREAVVAGRFLEIQWSATVALALLHPELMQ
jgi:ADP-ribose pyrophosphatase YjhB (NUDIX family)